MTYREYFGELLHVGDNVVYAPRGGKEALYRTGWVERLTRAPASVASTSEPSPRVVVRWDSRSGGGSSVLTPASVVRVAGLSS